MGIGFGDGGGAAFAAGMAVVSPPCAKKNCGSAFVRSEWMYFDERADLPVVQASRPRRHPHRSSIVDAVVDHRVAATVLPRRVAKARTHRASGESAVAAVAVVREKELAPLHRELLIAAKGVLSQVRDVPGLRACLRLAAVALAAARRQQEREHRRHRRGRSRRASFALSFSVSRAARLGGRVEWHAVVGQDFVGWPRALAPEACRACARESCPCGAAPSRCRRRNARREPSPAVASGTIVSGDGARFAK